VHHTAAGELQPQTSVQRVPACPHGKAEIILGVFYGTVTLQLFWLGWEGSLMDFFLNFNPKRCIFMIKIQKNNTNKFQLYLVSNFVKGLSEIFFFLIRPKHALKHKM